MDDYDNIDPYTSLYTLNQDKDWLDRTLRRVDRLVNTLQRMQRVPTIQTPRPQWPHIAPTPPPMPQWPRTALLPLPPPHILDITPGMSFILPRGNEYIALGDMRTHAIEDNYDELIFRACRTLIYSHGMERISASPDDQVRRYIFENKPKNRGL